MGPSTNADSLTFQSFVPGSMLLVEKALWRNPLQSTRQKPGLFLHRDAGGSTSPPRLTRGNLSSRSARSGHEGRQNSFKFLAISTGPVKCFFTSSAQAVILVVSWRQLFDPWMAKVDNHLWISRWPTWAALGKWDTWTVDDWRQSASRVEQV